GHAHAHTLARGRAHADSKNHAEAMTHLSQLHDDAQALYLKACVHLERVESLRAEALCRRVLSLEPDHVPARLQLFLQAVGRADHAGARREKDALGRVVASLEDTAVVSD